MLKKIQQNLEDLKNKLNEPSYQQMASDFRKGVLREGIPCTGDKALEFAVIVGNVHFFHALYDVVYKSINLKKLVYLATLAVVQFPESNRLAYSIFERIKKSQRLQSIAAEDKSYFRIAFLVNNFSFFRLILRELSQITADEKALRNNFFRTISADDICLNIENGYLEIVEEYLNAQSFEVVIQILTYKECKILNSYYQNGHFEKVKNLIANFHLKEKSLFSLLAFYIDINDFEEFESVLGIQTCISDVIKQNDYSLLNKAFRCNNSKFAELLISHSSNNKYFLSMRIRFAQEENCKMGRLEIFKFLWKQEPIDYPLMQLCKSTYFKGALKSNNIEIAEFIWNNLNDKNKLAKEVGVYDFIHECVVSKAEKSVAFLLSEVLKINETKLEVIRHHSYKLFADICAAGWLNVINILFAIESEEKHLEMILSFSGFSIKTCAENNNYELLDVLIKKIPAEERLLVFTKVVRNLFYSLCIQNERFNSFLVIVCSIQPNEVYNLSKHILCEEFSANGADISDDFHKELYSDSSLKSARDRVLGLRRKGFSFTEIFDLQVVKQEVLPFVLSSKQMIPNLPHEINFLIGYHLSSAASVGYTEQNFAFIMKSMLIASIREIPHFEKSFNYSRRKIERDEVDQLRLLQVSLN